MSTLNPPTFPSEPKSASDPTTTTPAQCQNCKPAPLFSIKTLKTLFWYILIGFTSSVLLNYLGVNVSTPANGNPRSICLSRNTGNLCMSWASYPGNGLPDEAYDTITRFSTDCVHNGGRTEFKATMADGGVLFICQPLR
ncbi:hypothetical protein KCU81_g8759, partial [Aureobasidium melanogenum]|uniref:Uncharacterized protein n=1 Tax=Aureobasidium melanogenum (strain CBS 110374) TaxID=1043003 RepID=A0A074W094_AURM1